MPAGETSGACTLRLLEEGIVAEPGRSFGPAGEGWVRVALVPELAGCEGAIRARESVR